jgi:uncharacterized membrane protein
MFGLTPLGVVHTAISLVAVGAGLIALVRDREIAPESALGRVYFWATVLSCVTAFGIFQHGGFGKPHALAIITLLVLGMATWAQYHARFGQASRYVVTIGYSATFFFNMIPGTAETFTRLPAAAPVFTGPDDPALQRVFGLFFLLFLVGAVLQVRRLRAGQRTGSRAAQAG